MCCSIRHTYSLVRSHFSVHDAFVYPIANARFGMSLSIIASGAAGFAISYGLGQGATLVAAIWGVFIWKEFRTAPAGTSRLLTMMFAAFVIGLTLIVAARVA